MKQEESNQLRRKMLDAIRHVKNEMLQNQEERMTGTTKMTAAQNEQISLELHYHSQNMDSLLKDNTGMRQKIQVLRKELIEHGLVEQELAKRSHFCQRVIKKYRAQLEELKNAKHANEQPPQQNHMSAIAATYAAVGNGRQTELTDFLQRRIGEYERRQQAAVKQLTDVQAEYQRLIAKVKSQKESYMKLAQLISSFIDDLVANQPELVANSNEQQVDIHLNLEEIKGARDMQEELDGKSQLALALVLLKQIQPLVQEYEAHESKF